MLHVSALYTAFQNTGVVAVCWCIDICKIVGCQLSGHTSYIVSLTDRQTDRQTEDDIHLFLNCGKTEDLGENFGIVSGLIYCNFACCIVWV
jgi:hypothetical protein